MLFLQLPRKLPDENVSSTRFVPEPVERVDSQAISEPTKIENGKVAATHLFDEAGDSTVRIHEDSRRSMLTEFSGLRDLLSDPFSFSSSEEPSEALLDYRNPVGGMGDRRLFDDMGGLSGLIFESRRHLVVGSDGVNVPLPLHISGTAPQVQKSKSPSPSPAPLSRPQSLPVGNTGMILHLINLAQPPFVASNSTSSFTSAPSRWVLPDMDPDHMQAIGESALPVTFKNLQRSTSMERLYPALAFNSGRGGPDIAQKCRFSMKLQEPPMDNSPGKDEQWTLIDQLLGNITNSDSMRVAGTEDKTTEKKKDAEAIAEAASARSKAAYASTVS